MKRLSPVIAMGLTVVGAGAAGVTATAGAITHAGYSVSGLARSAYPTPAGPGYSVLSIAARSGLSGQNPDGYVTVKGDTGLPMGAFTAGGAVTCLRVSGNKAAIKYRFARATGAAAAFRGGGVEVFVQDNGEPHGGQPADASASNPPQPAGAFDATASQCDDPNIADYNRVRSGDYTVARRAHTRSRREQGHHPRVS